MTDQFEREITPFFWVDHEERRRLSVCSGGESQGGGEMSGTGEKRKARIGKEVK